MSYCQALVQVTTAKTIDVLFCNASQITYIGESLVADPILPKVVSDVEVIVDDEWGRRSTLTETVLIDFKIGEHEDSVEAHIKPGSFPFLVLGTDWFQKTRPQFISELHYTITVASKAGVTHKMPMESLDDGVSASPAVFVVDRIEETKAYIKSEVD